MLLPRFLFPIDIYWTRIPAYCMSTGSIRHKVFIYFFIFAVRNVPFLLFSLDSQSLHTAEALCTPHHFGAFCILCSLSEWEISAIYNQLAITQLCGTLMFPSTDAPTCSAEKQR